MIYRHINRPDLALARDKFESACHCSRAYCAALAEYLAIYGDHGPDISGAGRDHFPAEAKDHLRRIARAVTTLSEEGYAARPKGIRHSTLVRLSREVATRDGTGFYGPQPLI